MENYHGNCYDLIVIQFEKNKFIPKLQVLRIWYMAVIFTSVQTYEAKHSNTQISVLRISFVNKQTFYCLKHVRGIIKRL